MLMIIVNLYRKENGVGEGDRVTGNRMRSRKRGRRGGLRDKKKSHVLRDVLRDEGKRWGWREDGMENRGGNEGRRWEIEGGGGKWREEEEREGRGRMKGRGGNGGKRWEWRD